MLAGILLAISTLSQSELLKLTAADAARPQDLDEWQRLILRHDDPQRRNVTEQELFDSDQRQRLLNILHMATGGGSFLFLLLWLYRAYRNLPALGTARPRFSAGWAVGYWFIPVLNLIRPCEVMLELARGSDPGRTSGGTKSGFRPHSNLLILIWWIGNVGGGTVAIVLVASHMQSSPPTLEELISLSQLVASITLAGCALSFLQILVILRIDRDQEARNSLLRSPAEPSLSFLRNYT